MVETLSRGTSKKFLDFSSKHPQQWLLSTVLFKSLLHLRSDHLLTHILLSVTSFFTTGSTELWLGTPDCELISYICALNFGYTTSLLSSLVPLLFPLNRIIFPTCYLLTLPNLLPSYSQVFKRKTVDPLSFCSGSTWIGLVYCGMNNWLMATPLKKITCLSRP